MKVYAAIQVAIVGVRTVIDRSPVGTIAKTEQGWWLIMPAVAVIVMVSILVLIMPILVLVMPILVLVVKALMAVVMSVMATVLGFVTSHCS